MTEECPKEECWHWIPPGGMADMSGKTYQGEMKEILKKIKFTKFPLGGCACTWGKTGKCTRIHPDGEADFFEPL